MTDDEGFVKQVVSQVASEGGGPSEGKVGVVSMACGGGVSIDTGGVALMGPSGQSHWLSQRLDSTLDPW